jgi:hypothetical protein
LDQTEHCHEIHCFIAIPDASAKLGFGEFLKPLNLVPTLFAWLLMWNQQTSFINVVIFYSTQIFEAAGGAISSFASTVIMGVVQVLATVLASFLIDRAGRRYVDERNGAPELGLLICIKYSQTSIYILNWSKMAST